MFYRAEGYDKEFFSGSNARNFFATFHSKMKSEVDQMSDVDIVSCNLEEWADYYYNNVRTSEQIDDIGRRLYDKVHNILPTENRFYPLLLDSITEEDCINYIHYLVIDRQYEGYLKEHGRLWPRL